MNREQKKKKGLDPYRIIGDVIDKLKSLELFKDEMKDVNDQFKKLMNYGFLNAFLNIKFLDNIIIRLDECKTEKELLADYLTDNFDTEIKSFFIESGSTLAYFAKSLADRMLGNDEKPRVITNNFFVQTLLWEVFTELRITSGFLRKHYLAYLPFASDKQVSESNNIEELRRTDRIIFDRLNYIISLSDTIYMTASTFGLLTGPSTRSRDNAIFKYCLLNNTARRPIKFCITEPKVFRYINNHNNIVRYKWTPNDTENRSSLLTHFKECCSVFDIQLLCDTEEYGCIKRSKIDASKIEQAIDGVLFKEYCLCRKDKKYCDNKQDGLIHFRSVPAELGLYHTRGLMENNPVVGCYDTWLNYLNGQPKGNIEIIIGCFSGLIVKELLSLVDEANQFIQNAGYNFYYKILYPTSETDTRSILHLVVT